MLVKCRRLSMDRDQPKMLKVVFVIYLVAIATSVSGARITRSPGGAGWHGNSARGFNDYSDNGPSIVAARSGGSWGSGNFGRSSGGSSLGWRNSGLSARSSGWGNGGSSYDGFAARSYDDQNSGFSGRSNNLNSLSGYSDYSGNHGGLASRSSGGYGGYSGSGGWGSSDYTDASGRSVSWQASW